MSGQNFLQARDSDIPARLVVRPGTVAVACAVSTIAFTVLSFWFPWAVGAVVPILFAVVVLAVADFRSLKSNGDRVSVSLSSPSSIGRGVRFDVVLRGDLEVTHRTKIEVRVEIPSEAIAANQAKMRPGIRDGEPQYWIDCSAVLTDSPSFQLTRSFMISVRGKYCFGPVWLRRSGRFGMLEAHRRYDSKVSVDVLPETFWSVQQLDVDDASERRLLDRIAKTRHQGTGTEFESLSEFRFGDDLQRIDWRASARNRHLIIRRFQVERHRDLMILVDCGRLMASETRHGTKLDCAVDSALMLGRVALRAGDRCGLASYDDRVKRFIPPLTGGQAMSTLVHNVYDLRSVYRESDFGAMFETLQVRHRKRSLVVVLSDISDLETTKRFRASMIALAKRHVVLFAAIRTPLLSELPRRPVDSILSASRQTVAFRLQQERERAVNSLRRSAINVLDVEPSQLTVPLINHFVNLRVQNRL